MRSLQGLAILLGLCCVAAHAEPRIYLGLKASPMEHFAAEEVQRYIYASTGQVWAIESTEKVARQAEGVVVGTSLSLPETPEMSWPFSLEPPRDDGYLLCSAGKNNGLVIVAAMTPLAVQYGVYGFLQEIGFGFYPSGDTLPDRPPWSRNKWGRSFSLSRSPALSVRGTVLRDTYLVGPGAWSYEDFRHYFDQMVKMGLNTCAVYAEQEGPFWRDDSTVEEMVDLSPQAYLAGTGAFCNTSSSPKPQNRKDLWKRALAYAASRGIRVGVGIEMPTGDPTLKGTQEALDTRVRRVLEDFPEVRHLWLWAPELSGVQLPSEPLPGSTLDAYLTRWAPELGIQEVNRASTAARIALAAIQVEQTVKAIRPDVLVVLSGWGGETSYRASDFLPGWDRVLPNDTVLSCLDEFVLRPSVSRTFFDVRARRCAWPILWIERDGDLWMPQPSLRELAGATRSALDAGCNGLMALHWRTKAVDESLGYFARLAWQPELSVDDYLKRRALDVYGQELGKVLTPYLGRLNDLGYRWVGGLGQYESAPYVWSRGVESQRAKLTQIGSELRSRVNREGWIPTLLPDLAAPLDWGRDLLGMPFALGRQALTDPIRLGREVIDVPVGVGRDIVGTVLPGAKELPVRGQVALDELYGRIRFVLAFDRAMELLGDGGAFQDHVSHGRSARAFEAFKEARLSESMHLFASYLSTKEELGALAEMNHRAWAQARTSLRDAGADTASLESLPEVMKQQPRLFVLPDRVIVVGRAPERASLLVRSLGQKKFQEHGLPSMEEGIFDLVFPSRENERAVEYGVKVLTSDGATLVWPPAFPAVVETRHVMPTTIQTLPDAPSVSVEPVRVKAEADSVRGRVELTWQPRPGECYEISRNGRLMGTVYEGWWQDSSPLSGTAAYRIVTRHLKSGGTAESMVDVTLPAPGLPAKPGDVRVTSRGGWNVIGWTCDGTESESFVITKLGRGQTKVAEYRVEAEPGHYVEYGDRVEQGQAFSYTVSGVARDGRTGPATAPIGIFASSHALTPVVQLSFQDETRLLESIAQVGANSLALGGAGWGDLPAQPTWASGRPITISLKVKLDDDDGMPVLLCRGPWRQPAYYVQLFGQSVRFFVAGQGTLDAGELRPGTWHHVAVTFGRGEMRVYVDGQMTGQKRANGGKPFDLDSAVLARYGVRGDPGFANGVIDDIRIYEAALTPQEIAALYSDAAR